MDRAEAKGVGVSVLGHALLAYAFYWVASGTTIPLAQPSAFEVSYVDEVGLTAASPEPAPSAQASVAPEVAPPEEAAPAPAPEPVAEPTPPPPRATPRPAPTRERVRPAPPAPPRTVRQQGNATTRRTSGSLLGPDLLRGIGNDRSARSDSPPAATYGPAERASVNQAIASALRRCARQPLPADDADTITVDYRVTLNPDGSLGDVQFIRVNNNNPNLARYERRMRDLGMNVLRGCTPIRGLPQAFYDVRGGRFPYTFDPRAGR